MKFKDKRLRTTHKCCKTCCFKAKIRCVIESYGFRDEDGEGICQTATATARGLSGRYKRLVESQLILHERDRYLNPLAPGR
jgi:hypothetical protein